MNMFLSINKTERNIIFYYDIEETQIFPKKSHLMPKKL